MVELALEVLLGFANGALILNLFFPNTGKAIVCFTSFEVFHSIGVPWLYG